MTRKQFFLLLLITGITLTSGCARRSCCNRFPLMNRMRERIQLRRGWCPNECGQAIEAASYSLTGACCDQGYPGGACCDNPVVIDSGFDNGLVPQMHSGFTDESTGPILDVPSFPEPRMPIAQDPDRLAPQPVPQPSSSGQAQPRPYVPEN